MKRMIMLITILAAFLSGQAAISQEAAPDAGVTNKRIILTVKEARGNAENYKGRKVVVVGVFMGWNGRCKPPAPMRNDWMIQDKEGNCIWARGMYPEDCSAVTKIGVGNDVAVEGFLRIEKKEVVIMSTRTQEVIAQQKQKKKEQTQKQYDEMNTQLQKILDKQNLQNVLKVSDISFNPSVFVGSERHVKGQYFADKGHCEGAPPFDNSVWMFEDLLGKCIFVHGQRPEIDGKALNVGDLVTIKAVVKQKETAGKTVYYLDTMDAPEKEAESVTKKEPVKKTEAPKKTNSVKKATSAKK
ncbi:MAG: hypothetical protein WCX65_08855 [bacterium]